MRLLVVGHDAGGANVLAAWLATDPRPGAAVDVVADGPAAAILGVDAPSAALPAIEAYDLVVCGSSGGAELERRAVRAARAAGVRSVVWLDHWIGYRERFVLDGALVLPDEVWVGDADALRLARDVLPPEAEVRDVGNPYMNAVVADVRAHEDGAPHAGERVLYVTEPTSVAAQRATGDPLGWGYEERATLRAWLAGLMQTWTPPPVAVRLRPHPSEATDKYAEVIADAPLDVALSNGGPLAADLAWADTVVGCDSMAMAVALAAGRRVVSVIPAGGKPLTLPFTAIERRPAG